MQEKAYRRNLFAVGLDAKEQWNAIIAEFQHSHVFHSWGWAKTFAEAYKHEPVLLCYGTQESIEVALPVSRVFRPFGKSFFVSMPYSDFAGPLFHSEIPEELWARILEELDTEEIEIRSEMLFHSLEVQRNYSTYRIDLPDNEQEMLANLPTKSVCYPIRKARKDGFRIKSGIYNDVHFFYELMSLTRRKHGLPTPPFRFYQALYRNVIEPGNGTIYIAENAQKNPVASSLFLWHGDTGYYKYNASDPAAKVGNANHLLLWEGVSEAIQRKCCFFDLGRATSTNKGLVQFKKHWLGREVPLNYAYVRSNNSIESIPSGGSKTLLFSQKIFQLLPVFFSKIAGNCIYRYFS